MKLLWWRKEKREKVDAGVFTDEFYKNQAMEMARKIIESPMKEEADKIIEQFKLSHPGEWIENDDARNFQADGYYQRRPFTREDAGKFYLGTIYNGYYTIRQIQRVIYTHEYGFIPCPTKDCTDLDVLSYRGTLRDLVESGIKQFRV